MPDDPNTPPMPPQPAAPAPQPDGTGTPAITPEIQALIDARAQDAATKAHNAAWKQAREKYEKPASGGQQPPPPKPNEQPAHPPQNVAEVVRAETNRIRSFERAVGQYGLDDNAIAMLEEDLNAANPSDPAEWVHKRAKAFGWKAGGSPTPATPAPANTPAPQTAPKGAPVTGGGAPANPTTITDDTPILRMSDADRIALANRIGVVAYVDRMRKEFKNVRVRFKQ